MVITDLQLTTSNVRAMKNFYCDLLGFHGHITGEYELYLKSGKTDLTFIPTTDHNLYHFAFLIPTGTIHSAIDYLEERNIELLPLKGDKIIHFYEGEAIYFHDPDGNIVEFIERPTLGYASDEPFSPKSIIQLNEIGLPVGHPTQITDELKERFGLTPYPDAPFSERFCWGGDYSGAFIIVIEGRHWLPTEIPAPHVSFEITYKNNGKTYHWDTSELIHV